MSSQLINGMIPAGKVCPFRNKCESFECHHQGEKHECDYSCAIARAYDLICPVKNKFDEATIIINGIILDEGQSLTVRVAIENYLHTLCLNGGLMIDAHDHEGKKMTQLYKERIKEIRSMIHGSI